MVNRYIFRCIGVSLLGMLMGGCEQGESRSGKQQAKAIEEARAFLALEKFEEAESTLVALEGRMALNAKASGLMGKARVGLFDDPGAIERFKTSVALDREQPDVWLALTQALRRSGLLEEANTAIQDASMPDMVGLIYEAGQVDMQLGAFEEAASHFEYAIEKDSTFLDAYYALGTAYQRSGRTADGERVLVQYRRLSEVAGDVDLDRQLVELNPNSAVAHYNLARAYEKQGEDDTAITYYLKALSLDGEMREAYNNMGIVFFRQGDDERAVRAFRRAIALSDTTAKYYFNLGAVYARRGVVDEAEKLWQKTLQLDPSYEKARTFLSELEAARQQAGQ